MNSFESRLKVSFVTLIQTRSKKFKLSVTVRYIGTGEEQMRVPAVAMNNGPMK